MPKKNRNSVFELIPKLFEKLYSELIKLLVSIAAGFDNTATKGKIEATPATSRVAIIKIIKNN